MSFFLHLFFLLFKRDNYKMIGTRRQTQFFYILLLIVFSCSLIMLFYSLPCISQPGSDSAEVENENSPSYYDHDRNCVTIIINSKNVDGTETDLIAAVADADYNNASVNVNSRRYQRDLTSFKNETSLKTVTNWKDVEIENYRARFYEKREKLRLRALRQRVLRLQWQEISKEMIGYKFDEIRGRGRTGNLQLDNLIMEKGGQPIRNVIFTTWRSGSTFLGEVVNIHPGTYYHCEPLDYFGIKQVRTETSAKEGLRVINQLLNCNYTDLNDYMRHGKAHHWLFEQNPRLWRFCGKRPDICWDTEFLAKMCKLFPFQTVKTVRMRLRWARMLLENEKFNIRLLFLVRDPRGTIQSRSKRSDWCPKHPDCYDPVELCKDMVDDFTVAEQLRQKYPDRFLAIRYEDMSLSPFESIKKIFKFFRLQYTPKVSRYLRSHTRKKFGGVYSTYRNSKTAPFHWRKDLLGIFSLVTHIQNSCVNAMKLWGYAQVSNPDQLLKSNHLRKPRWKEMFVFNKTDPQYGMYVQENNSKES